VKTLFTLPLFIQTHITWIATGIICFIIPDLLFQITPLQALIKAN